MSGVCARCNQPLPEPARTGPPRKYCTRYCKDKATRTRGRDRMILAQTIDELFAFVEREYG